MISFLKEARRRRVFRVAALYIVAAWVILQAADLAFPALGISEAAIRYVWIGALIGFPFAVVFGWYYDITSEGIVHTPPAHPDHEIDISLHRADYLIMAGLAFVMVAVTYGLVGEIIETKPPAQSAGLNIEIDPHSIAVLPFDNMSDDEGNEYFSDGMSEELLNQLAALSDLKVAARKSSFYFKNRDESIQQIANQLKVRNILEGSVRKAGDQVRITAQLIDAETGFHLWSQTYDRMLEDIFNVQEEIAVAIAQQLKVTLLNPSGTEAQPYRARDPEAYEQYLLGEFHRNKRTSNGLEQAVGHYQRAIELDDEFAPAFDSLAYTYLISAYFGNRSRKDAIKLAQPYIDEALRLSPDLAKVHATMGLVEHMDDRYVLANEHFARAVELKPNLFRAHNNWGLNLVLQSRLKEASAAYIRAQALDPLNDSINFNFGALLMLMGQFDEGLRFLEKAHELNPDRNVEHAIAHWSSAYGYFVEAIEWGNKALKKNPDVIGSYTTQSWVLARLGLWEPAGALLTRARAISPDSFMVKFGESEILIQTGDTEGFYSFAEREVVQIQDDSTQPVIRIDRYRLRWYGVAQLLKGDNQGAIDYLLRAVGGPEGISTVTYEEMETLKLLAIAYQRQGQTAEASEILEHCLTLVSDAQENGWATPQLLNRLGEIYAVHGNREAALEALSASVEQGWRELGMLDHRLFWQPLHDDPEFLRIKAIVDDDLALQRELVMQLGLISELTTP